APRPRRVRAPRRRSHLRGRPSAPEHNGPSHPRDEPGVARDERGAPGGPRAPAPPSRGHSQPVRHRRLRRHRPLPGTSATGGSSASARSMDRARLAARGFEWDAVSAPVVAEICRRLDGIPLAMELAAARLNMMTPDQLLDRLDRQFSVLGSRPGSPIPHQQTLEATLDWSYDALGPVERTLFNRLSVFTGGFTLDAAEEVCADSIVPKEAVLEILGRLIETSLVAGSEDRPGRFRLLKPIAQYAAMRLADGEDAALLRERHA